MLKFAFKEWAVICRALAEGRQALIIRKGGVAESNGEFQPEHERFWLYPTYLHDHRDGIKPGAVPLLDEVAHDRPPQGRLRLTHFVEAAGAHYVDRLDQVDALDRWHIWSQQTIEARFRYRRPGLFVLPVRVYRAPAPLELPETPAYAGCRSWVELDQALPTADAPPVMSDDAFAAICESIASVIGKR